MVRGRPTPIQPRRGAPQGAPRATRRQVLRVLSALGGACATGVLPALVSGCGQDAEPEPPIEVPSAWLEGGPAPTTTNVRALIEVLLPSEVDSRGVMTSAGANDVGALEVMSLDYFIPLAQAVGLLPELPEALMAEVDATGPVLLSFLSTELDTMAAEVAPLTSFAFLERGTQEELIADGFDDPERQPWLEFVRSVALLAYLGAVRSDFGLVELGYPPFEDLDDGLAVSGYPRTPTGRLIDAETEDLALLAAAGQLDDYTYNEAPAPTVDDDLSDVVDASGDLF